MSALRIFSAPPPNLPATGARDLFKLLGGPSLIHFPGRPDRAPLAVVALLHGNETSGWTTMQRLLKKQRGTLPRPLLLLLGNLRAAELGTRFLPNGADWNRVWNVNAGRELSCAGRGLNPRPERSRRGLNPRPTKGGEGGGVGGMGGVGGGMAFARAALDEFRRAGIWAGVDLHNNTGRNPLYAAVFDDENNGDDGDGRGGVGGVGGRVGWGGRGGWESLRLAADFSGVVVATGMPRGTCMEALSTLAPATTLECGPPGSPAGIARAAEYLTELLARDDLPPRPPTQLLRTTAKLKLPPRHSVVFADAPGTADLAVPPTAERWNFRRLRPGFVFARLRPGASPTARFPTVDEAGADVFARYFAVADGEVRTTRPLIPAMLTVDEKAARDDCLCYIMEEQRTEPPPGS